MTFCKSVHAPPVSVTSSSLHSLLVFSLLSKAFSLNFNCVFPLVTHVSITQKRIEKLKSLVVTSVFPSFEISIKMQLLGILFIYLLLSFSDQILVAFPPLVLRLGLKFDDYYLDLRYSTSARLCMTLHYYQIDQYQCHNFLNSFDSI